MKSSTYKITIPNLVTLLRIILSLGSLVFLREPVIFLSVILIAGVTDILDGILARALHQQSNFGAKLDSIADTILYSIVVLFIYINFISELRGYIALIAFVTVYKFIPILIYGYRFQEFVIVHTYLNKVIGILLFFLPYLLVFTSWKLYYGILFTVAMIAIIEEILIACRVERIDRDLSTIFRLRKHS